MVAVEISSTTSPTTVVARLSAWACDKIGDCGAMFLSLLHAATVTPKAATASASSECCTVRMSILHEFHG